MPLSCRIGSGRVVLYRIVLYCVALRCVAFCIVLWCIVSILKSSDLYKYIFSIIYRSIDTPLSLSLFAVDQTKSPIGKPRSSSSQAYPSKERDRRRTMTKRRRTEEQKTRLRIGSDRSVIPVITVRKEVSTVEQVGGLRCVDAIDQRRNKYDNLCLTTSGPTYGVPC